MREENMIIHNLQSRRGLHILIAWIVVFSFLHCSTDVRFSKNPIKGAALEIFLEDRAVVSNESGLVVGCRIKSLSSKALILKQLQGKDKIVRNELTHTSAGIYLLPGKEIRVPSCATLSGKNKLVEINVIYEEQPGLLYEKFTTERAKGD